MRHPPPDASAYGPQNAARMAAAISDGQRIDSRFSRDPDGDREEDIQQAIIQELRARGFTVLQTTVRYRMVKCPACGDVFHNHADTGQDAGVPDLLVSIRWPVAAKIIDIGTLEPAWLGLEVKGPKTALSPRQKELRAQGRIIVVRSVADALRAVGVEE